MILTLIAGIFFSQPAGTPDSRSPVERNPPPPPPYAPNGNRPEPPKDQENILYYRGNRTYSEKAPLKVMTVNCFRLNEESASLEISFNQSIDPRTVNIESILLNGKNLPETTRFAFNKKGDKIKLYIPMEEAAFVINVNNIKAFDGAVLEQTELKVSVR